MVGLIWFVQVVHYPLFGWIGDDEAVPYAVEHQRRTALVVGLPMAVEGVTALWLLADPPAGSSRVWPFVGCVLVAVVHVSTVLLQVPQGRRQPLLVPPANDDVVAGLQELVRDRKSEALTSTGDVDSQRCVAAGAGTLGPKVAGKWTTRCAAHTPAAQPARRTHTCDCGRPTCGGCGRQRS
jgi:hypothetical protein